MMKGSTISIESLKHDKSLHRRWETNEILYTDTNIVIGKNNRTMVVERNEKRWRTKEPAIFYFDDRYWFNIILLFGENYYYYCNMASPFTYANKKITYIDYDLDIIVDDSYAYHIMDEEEFLLHLQQYDYEEAVIQKVMEHKEILIEWIEKRKGPFHPSFIEKWLQVIEKEDGVHE